MVVLSQNDRRNDERTLEGSRFDSGKSDATT